MTTKLTPAALAVIIVTGSVLTLATLALAGVLILAAVTSGPSCHFATRPAAQTLAGHRLTELVKVCR